MHLVEQSGGVNVEGDSRVEGVAAVTAEAASLGRVVEQKTDRRAKPGRVTWRHGEAGKTILDDVALTLGGGDADRLAHSHGFENRRHAGLKVVLEERDRHHRSARVQVAQ